ncbi:UDP-N-acetylmuramoyl-L-alanine--D-glutamate ligase [Candidatus Peribacteria bacterium]|nr:UDP-N-acetylmuramoyl-L-alanine--D-glutamate ligase [Candidatus Peribacteria bacterium]
MTIQDLSGKKICILGYGKEGQAMLKAIEKYAPSAEVTIADKDPETCNTQHTTQLGSDYLKKLQRFDIIIKSPGIPHQAEFDAVKGKVTSSTQIFLDSIADTGARVVGVTGSKGKSTTSSLIFEMLKASGEDVFLIGNIGEPAISHLGDAKPGEYRGDRSRTIFVMEMSSYQLADLTVSPPIAVLTSFFPEHLDYHGSLEAYKEAKKHISQFQPKDGVILYSASSDDALEIAKESPGTHIPFSPDECPLPISDTHLLGDHNRSNIAAAWKVGIRLGVPNEVMLKVIREFKGLPHRLQSLGVHHGIEWIDDAISTTPESTIAALDALGDRVETIILGGQDRGNDFTELAKRLKTSAVKTVILFPGSGPRIRKSLEEVKSTTKIIEAKSMETAVKAAKDNLATRKPQPVTPIVLLSTASPSYNMFKNFEEKGEAFAKSIKK